MQRRYGYSHKKTRISALHTQSAHPLPRRWRSALLYGNICKVKLCTTFSAACRNRQNIRIDAMKYPWLDDYCLKKKGCEKDYKEEWKAWRYMLAGKMFAMRGTDKEDMPIITLKLEPYYGIELRGSYKDIVPGYYMNKMHWNSVRLDGDVPDDLLKGMIDESYQILLNSLPKKLQKEFQ